MDLIKEFKEFMAQFNDEESRRIWDEQSREFRSFWKDILMNEKAPYPLDAEVDDIIKILDRNAKGNTHGCHAIAKVMIPQGVWRKMFKEIKRDKKLRTSLFDLLNETDKKRLVGLIDEIYKLNEGRKNSLTGKSGNAINTMLGAYNPNGYLHIISLNDRRRVIEYLKLKGPDFEKDSIGKQIIESNAAILDYFETFGKGASPRAISKFFYMPSVKVEWKILAEDDVPWGGAKG